MENFKNYCALFLGFLMCFMLGAYTDGVIHCNKVVPLHSWVLIILYGIYFITYGILGIKKTK